MTVEEMYNYYFKEQFLNYYRKNIIDIRNNISLYKDNLKIEKYDITLEDIIERQENSKYLKELGFEYIENGIKILCPINEFWIDIKDYISKDITKLEVPFELIKDDICFFANFPNLHTLIINDYSNLTKESLKLIYNNTNIRKIYTNYLLIKDKDIYREKYFAESVYPYNVVMYKDLVLEIIDEKNKHKKSLSNDYDNLTINTYSIEEWQINALYNLKKEYFKSVVTINTNDGSEYIIKFKDKKTIESLSIKSDDSNAVSKFYNYLIGQGYDINNIYLDFVNINYYEINLSIYELIVKNTNLYFIYENNKSANYEEFKGMLESLNWYRRIIDEGNLSPVEKLMFAFDIMKTFNYKDNSSSKNDSRAPHKVIETGNIVCVGYAHLLNLILNKLDDNIKVSNFGLNCYDENKKYLGAHERNIVKIDDNKYNIHGIYILDATWDSIKDNVGDVVGEDYTALDLYRYFLIPAIDYEDVFQYDTLPNLLEIFLETTYNREGFYGLLLNSYDEKDKEETIKFLKHQLEKEYYGLLKENLSEEEIKKYLNIKRPSLETFNNILYNVRIAEGFEDKTVLKEIEKVNRINKFLITRMNDKGKKIGFFK